MKFRVIDLGDGKCILRYRKWFIWWTYSASSWNIPCIFDNCQQAIFYAEKIVAGKIERGNCGSPKKVWEATLLQGQICIYNAVR